jgi:16S rRNA (guanine966-N2)-methyltransferase
MRLRIISGEFGGRFIKTPDSKFTRPTTDKVKQSVFNYLSNFFDFEDAIAADIYAGSGSLGFEMLSRGAEKVHFVEKNFPVVKILTENIQSLDVEKRVKLHKMKAVTFTATTNLQFDFIFADPPFYEYDVYDVVKNIRKRKLLKPGGIFMLERSIQTLEDDKKNMEMEPIKRLGDTCLYQIINGVSADSDAEVEIPETESEI